MTPWLIETLLWIAAGIVIKTLIPMPWLDDPIRGAYRKIKNLFKDKQEI